MSNEKTKYDRFLASKRQAADQHGFAPGPLPGFLMDFQSTMVDWAVRKGRAAIFADCGLGKTPMQLAWADQVVKRTNRPVLILTPLAVARQTVAEGEKFGIECRRSAGAVNGAGIYVANYEKIHLFDPHDFAGMVGDESSAIKAFDGKRRAQVTEFMRTLEFRLLCTATAAPNDYIELGTSSEALGELGRMDMLGRFFRNDQNSIDVGRRSHGHSAPKWRFKGHSEEAFWRWVCSWAMACRKPSDLGFDDAEFVLPPVRETEHVVKSRTLAPGMLFALPAAGLREEREERRRTIPERCEKAANLASDHDGPAVVWCHLNAEGDLLEKIIPGGFQIKGAHTDEEKEEKHAAFLSGEIGKLVIKPKIGAWGLNWQHCAKVVTFASHSFEQHYQAVRRCWRFGQKRSVEVDVVASEGEQGIKKNLARKAGQADRMFSALVANMVAAESVERKPYAEINLEAPSWI